jgi:hypothetical protein
MAVLVLVGGGVLIKTDRQRREALRIENERLVREQEELARTAERLARERAQLAEVVEHLSVERRVAEVDVLQQHTDVLGQVLQTVIRITEIGRDDELLTPQVFGVPGHVPHFDALVIKFEDDFVARGDLLRGRSLALFRRVYSETQAPEHGYWLGGRGAVPDVYRVTDEPSEFEVELWRDFWSYATDPVKAAGAGVRVAQGEAVYAPMRPGEHWLLTLEADGGLNLIKQGPSSLVDAAAPRRLTDTPTVGAKLRAAPPLEASMPE